MTKHALISDPRAWELFKTIETPDLLTIKPLITPMAQIKIDIVATDPLEKSVRKSLNFGHTIGHAIESLSMSTTNAKLEHGEAIGLGMIYEVELAFTMGIMNESDYDDVAPFLKSWFGHIEHNRNIDDWWPLMLMDKKNIGNKVNMSLISAPGKCLIDQLIEKEQLDLING